MDNTEKIYNSRIFVYYIKLFREKYTHVNISDILEYAGIDPLAVDDPLEWFSQDQADKFLERMTAYFDDPAAIAREAGRHVYSDKILGLFKQFSLKLLGTGYVFEKISKYASALTKSSVYCSRKIAPNKYEVRVKFKESVVESPLQEHNRLGILEAAPLMYSDKMATVESKKEGNDIVYTITWGATNSEKINKLLPYFLFISASIILLTGRFLNIATAINATYISIFLYLVLIWAKEHFRSKEIEKSLQSHEQMSEQIIDNYIEDYEQVKTLNRIGRIILRHGSDSDYLADIASTLEELKYKKIAFYTLDFKQNNIILKYNDGYKRDIKTLQLDLKAIKSPSPHNSLDKPKFFESPDSFKSAMGLSDIGQYFNKSDYPLILIPIIYDIAVLGYFFLTPEKSILPIGKKKYDFLTGIANHIALAIHKNHAFHTVAESDRIKTKFISTASHELRTPLQTMMGAISEMEQTRDMSTALPLLRTVVSNMSDRVSDLLDLHRIESKKYVLDIQELRPVDVLEKIRDEMVSIANVYKHETIFEDFDINGPPVRCDIKRFITALINLFNNSCKYTPQGGKIIFKYAHDRYAHKFSVIDNGVGIVKKDHEKVFMKFYRASNGKGSSVGGIGLGLSIAKELVDLHGGDISILSPLPPKQYDIKLDNDRLGTCMTIHLPIS